MAIDHLIRESEAPKPGVSPQEAAELILKRWGISGLCQPQAGERDLNLRIDARDGQRYLLKIWNHSQDRAVVDLQVQLLRHVGIYAPDLPLACVVADVEGCSWSTFTAADGREYAACLLSWLDGLFLRDVTLSAALSENLGRTLACLDRSLATFSHPASRRDMLWDVTRTHRLRELLPSLEGSKAQQLAAEALQEFQDHVLPDLRPLPRQVIHADFNLDNILVHSQNNNKVSGIIDFGDALDAPRVCDLAIACAYQLTGGKDPLSLVEPLVVGYHMESRLLDSELKVLPGLIKARLTGSLVITSHMAALHPDNREYLLIDTHTAERRLRQLSGHDHMKQKERLIDACRSASAQNP